MKNRTLFGIILLLFFAFASTAKIAVIANKNLSTQSKVAIRDFAEDIELFQGKTTWIDMSTYDETSSAVQLRSALLSLYNDVNDRLEGAIFVGDLPVVYYETITDFCVSNYYASFPCDFFFMDLNGTWSDNATDGMWNGYAHTGFFDDHSGNIAAEIWVSRIVLGSIPAIQPDENWALTGYLPRLRNRMAGGTDNVTRRELIVGNNSESGWDPIGWGGASLLGYGSNVTSYLRSPSNADSWNNLVSGLQNGYEYAFICEHANQLSFATSTSDFWNTDYLNMYPYSNVRFYNLFACGANLYVVDNCVGALLGQSQGGLVCLGSTKVGSMLNFDPYNQALGQDSSFGQAFKLWANQTALYAGRGCNEIGWYYGMTLLGAGNLKVKPYSLFTCLCKQSDIGNSQGGFSFNNSIFTVTGGKGTDIGGTSDKFRYSYLPLNGDGQIVVKVNSMYNSNANAKAGIMIRESLNPNSRHVSIVFLPKNGIQLLKRTSTGGSTAMTSTTGTVPYYLKLTRAGNVITAYKSSNNTTWTVVGSAITLTMNQNIFIGLVNASSNANSTSWGQFGEVSFPAQQVATRTNFSVPKYQTVLGGNADFKVYDNYSICSGKITDNQESRIRIMTTANNISFNWKVDSEPGFDFLKYYLNGTEIFSISGNQDWQSVQGGGGETVNCYEIIYTKDYSVSIGQDMGWVKDLKVW